MTGRLIVVSNRVPSDGPPSGGLVVALDECLTRQGGIWIGTSGQTSEETSEDFHVIPGDDYEIRTFDLTSDEHEKYYLAYANSVLWPLCHRRTDLMSLQAGAYEAYIGVNRRLARMMARLLRPDDKVWIHDYHFLPLAACLREEGVTATLGYFHHIPFPGTHDLKALPEHDLFPDWIGSFDMVGLQTQSDVATALEMYRTVRGAEMLRDGSLHYRGRPFEIRSFPIGIDAKGFAQEAKRRDGRSLLNLAKDERLVIGVDRLDYSKGLDNRLKAFGGYLEGREIGAEPAGPRASLLQIAPPTREAVEAYKLIRSQLEHTTGKLNGLHSDLDWTPIRYIHRAVPRETLAALYRAADVGFVTPFCDGMNLVAKEFVAAQDPDDPGVLILSQFAGAAEQMAAAVIVNPYDIGEMSRAIAMALSMDLTERRERHAVLSRGVFMYDVAKWADDYVAALVRISHSDRTADAV